MKYLDCLNDAQKKAVLSKEGPTSVLAGAGSGKTRVLTTRIYHLVREGVPAEQILAVTFTNKAAREMRERGRAVLGRISRAKGEGMRAQEFYEKYARGGFGARIAAEAWLRYEKTLAAEKALDFDDLIALPLRLLEEHSDIRALAQERWRYIHVDEYQDTNSLQEQLAGILAERHRNLFVVGDGDQAIYGWRGAKMENILDFEKKYPEAQTIILERNYRSTKNLVDAANAVIEK